MVLHGRYYPVAAARRRVLLWLLQRKDDQELTGDPEIVLISALNRRKPKDGPKLAARDR
jgi:hypothetical protein